MTSMIGRGVISSAVKEAPLKAVVTETVIAVKNEVEAAKNGLKGKDKRLKLRPPGPCKPFTINNSFTYFTPSRSQQVHHHEPSINHSHVPKPNNRYVAMIR